MYWLHGKPPLGPSCNKHLNPAHQTYGNTAQPFRCYSSSLWATKYVLIASKEVSQDGIQAPSGRPNMYWLQHQPFAWVCWHQPFAWVCLNVMRNLRCYSSCVIAQREKPNASKEVSQDGIQAPSMDKCTDCTLNTIMLMLINSTLELNWVNLPRPCFKRAPPAIWQTDVRAAAGTVVGDGAWSAPSGIGFVTAPAMFCLWHDASAVISYVEAKIKCHTGHFSQSWIQHDHQK